MSLPGEGSGRVLLLAPLGRDAELGCAALGRAGIACCTGRELAVLERTSLDDLGALVLTEEVLTGPAVEAVSDWLDAQASWSNLTVILLVDPDHIRATGDAGDRLRALAARPGVILLQRPTGEETLVSVVRAAVVDRRRQLRLLNELEAREAAEARAQTLAHEMTHRVKNAFALALSIARQTFRSAETLRDAQEAFTGRLEAMVRAQDLLRPGGDEVVDLSELVDRTLAPYRPVQGSAQISVAGPQVLIPKNKATALAMAFHELATNAAKYGALSAASGCVGVEWQVEPTSSGGELTVEWRERGGPPVLPPARRGFGSRLVERGLAHDLGGSTELSFERTGVVCTIKVPISAAAG